ncbi:hypothetical protein X737_29480 [Mesorhizobium sp. L48C026A00]|nr:hypothetical protein X737_29480 [Mesorhizobium sp. L48C026A00]
MRVAFFTLPMVGWPMSWLVCDDMCLREPAIAFDGKVGAAFVRMTGDKPQEMPLVGQHRCLPPRTAG